MKVERSTVVAAYRAILGREPESEAIIAHYINQKSAEKAISDIANSPEAQLIRAQGGLFSACEQNPLFHFSSMFDAQDVIARHARADLHSTPEVITNFLGVKIEEIYYPPLLQGRAGTLEPIPAPANWHADIAEFAAALRAVDLTKGDRFTVAELGCGWGCWLNNTGVAAYTAGKKPTLIGVEGDKGHLAFAKRCCKLNGFSEDDVSLLHGVASSNSGVALFPRQQVPGTMYGLQPIFDASAAEIDSAQSSGCWDALQMFTVEDIIAHRPQLDLLHIDIQGGEADLIEKSRPTIDQRVSYMVIGTHSRVIEGRIISALKGSNWRLEMERPALVKLEPSGPIVLIDGVQGWRNMALSPD